MKRLHLSRWDVCVIPPSFIFSWLGCLNFKAWFRWSLSQRKSSNLVTVANEEQWWPVRSHVPVSNDEAQLLHVRGAWNVLWKVTNNTKIWSVFRIGTAALAVQVVGSNWPKPHYTLLVTGLCRFQILQVLKEKPYPVAEVEQLDRLEQFTNQHKSEEELGELSEQFYKYAVQVNCLILFIFNQCIDTRFVAFFFLFFCLFAFLSLFLSHFLVKVWFQFC